MRIVSLHPACTEWVVAFGAVEDLVDRSHACQYTNPERRIPIVTSPCLTPTLERQTQRTNALSFNLDEKLLAKLNPDVLLAADGVSTRQLEEMQRHLDGTPAIFLLNPTTFKEVLDGALRLGKTIGRLREAMRYIGETEKNLLMLQHRLAPDHDTTTVCIERLNPIRSSRRWVPDLVELAGGRLLESPARDDAPSDEWKNTLREGPDVVLVMPPSGGIDAALRMADQLTKSASWRRLRAVESGRVFAFDGALFSHPGPRLYHAVELLTAALHPGQALVVPQADEMARVRISSPPAK